MKEQIIDTFRALKEKRPLVHNITNFVVMNNTANALLAIGASPLMAHAKEELEDILNIASSLVVNMGTLDKRWLKAMLKSGKIATKLSVPWVFDPVGVGASQYRTNFALELIQLHPPTIIRANASEIMSLTNAEVKTKGVDSTISSDAALDAAKTLAEAYQNTVILSGATDFIVSSSRLTQIHNGAKIMTQVTGMGCTASAVVGACLGVCENHHLAGVTAMAIMGVASEIAQKNSTGSGSFQVAFIDALYNLNASQLSDMLRLTHG